MRDSLAAHRPGPLSLVALRLSGLRVEDSQEFLRRDDLDTFIEPHVEQMAVAADDVLSQTLSRREEIFVVVRIGSDSFAPAVFDHPGYSLEPLDEAVALSVREICPLLDARIVEDSSDLFQDVGRRNGNETRIGEEGRQDSPGSAVGIYQPARQDVGVEDDAGHMRYRRKRASLTRDLAAGPLTLLGTGAMLGLVSDPVGLLFSEPGVGSRLEELEKPRAGGAVHRFELCHRDERGYGFALALDDELVMAKRNSIQVITKPFPDFESRDSFSHRAEL